MRPSPLLVTLVALVALAPACGKEEPTRRAPVVSPRPSAAATPGAATPPAPSRAVTRGEWCTGWSTAYGQKSKTCFGMDEAQIANGSRASCMTFDKPRAEDEPLTKTEADLAACRS